MNILNELNEACDYIENNICKDIEIDELAKITNQSNDSINRFFVSMLGTTIKIMSEKEDYRLLFTIYKTAVIQ